MAINQNHLFEDLNGIKCSIVEKNVAPQRVDFLRRILEYNRFTVVVVPSPPLKGAAPPAGGAPVVTPAAASAPAPAAAPSAALPAAPSAAPSAAPFAVPASAPVAAQAPPAQAPVPAAAPDASAQPVILAGPPPPETFTVGVTDTSFNPINAIFGRLLKAPGGHTVTLAYWQQKENEPNDEVPYFEAGK
jgi:hypothetical protein